MLATASTVRPGACKCLPAQFSLLGRCYARTAMPLPEVQPIHGADMPEPYRGLLVHSRDMTPTLEAFYGEAMAITVLSREREVQTYLREVLLKTVVGRLPVEYGVIRIHLNRLPPAAMQAVLDEARPLGNILQTEAIPHLSWPQGFFRVPADAHLNQVFGLNYTGDLYGRRNLLLDGARHLLADVIEVLAPSTEGARVKS